MAGDASLLKENKRVWTNTQVETAHIVILTIQLAKVVGKKRKILINWRSINS